MKRRRYVITRYVGFVTEFYARGFVTEFYAGSRDGEPTWTRSFMDAFHFVGEEEFDAAQKKAQELGAKVQQRGVPVELWN